MSKGTRNGILTAGNFIVDRIKKIDAYPAENMLATIESESRSNGGGPYNVLKDLAAMGVKYPLSAAGRIGADGDGKWIIDDCRKHGIDFSLLLQDDSQTTSYTDVMTAKETGRRTFFHQRGANANFTGEKIDFEANRSKVFHLAYLLLLDGLDNFAEDSRTYASHLLEKASKSGLIISIDVVSADHPRFRDIVLNSLPHADHLLINEVEAGRTLEREINPADADEVSQAAVDLLEYGVRQAVVLHTEFGAARAGAGGSLHHQGAVCIPAQSIEGANGAGDAFAAGYLHGVHECLSPEKSLELAACAAASCLMDTSPSGGLCGIDECLAMGRTMEFRTFASAL